MKNLFFVLSMTLIVSCGPDYKSQVESLQLKNDSLIRAYDLKQNELSSYILDLNEIQQNISELTEREQLLKNKFEGDLNENIKSKILSDLEGIRQSLASNKKRLASLQSKLKKSNAKIVELETMVSNLNQEIQLRDESIALLSKNITDLNDKIVYIETEIKNVKNDNEQKTKDIADKTTKLNTAYYTVGTYKSLREKHVISNDGKIFKSKEINPNYSTESFTKIDITSTKEITIDNAKEIKFASIHPIDSYALTKENDKITSIQVTNPERFWSSSKHLIVVTN